MPDHHITVNLFKTQNCGCHVSQDNAIIKKTTANLTKRMLFSKSAPLLYPKNNEIFLTKKCVPCGVIKKHIHKNFYQTILQYSEGHESSRTATALFAKLDRKWKDRWSETVHSINFSHSAG